MDDILVNFGGEVKAMGDGRVAGYGVTFGGRDMDGEHFRANTYYGAHKGDGVDSFFHHCLPVKGLSDAMNRELSDHIFPAAKAKQTDKGIFFEVILDMADEYEKQLYAAAKAGKIGFSTGAPAHTVKRSEDGGIDRWIISELSFTPKPCDPRNKVVALKSFQEDDETDYAALFDNLEIKATETPTEPKADAEEETRHTPASVVAILAAMPIKTYLETMGSVVSDYDRRLTWYVEDRTIKSGRTISADNLRAMGEVADGMDACAGNLDTHRKKLRALVEQHSKPAAEPPSNSVAREFTRYLALGAGANMTL